MIFVKVIGGNSELKLDLQFCQVSISINLRLHRARTYRNSTKTEATKIKEGRQEAQVMTAASSFVLVNGPALMKFFSTLRQS